MQSAQTTPPLHSLEAVNTKNLLEGAQSDPTAFKEAVVNCFFDASIATSETASFFLIRTTRTGNQAANVADIVKSLPTAIPARNAVSLARVAAFLAVTFEAPECAVPLESFSFADTFVKRKAVAAVVSQISHLLTLRHAALEPLLQRVSAFVNRLIADPDPFCRFDVIRALTGLPSRNPQISSQYLAKFLMALQLTPSPFADRTNDFQHFDEQFEPFFISEVARLDTSPDSFRHLLFSTIIRAFDFSTTASLHALCQSHSSLLGKAVSEIGVHLVLYLLTLIAAIQACHAHFSSCLETLDVTNQILNHPRCKTAFFHNSISSIVSSLCTSISSIATAAAADDIAQSSSVLFTTVQERQQTQQDTSQPPSDNRTLQNADDKKTFAECEVALKHALRCNCPAAIMALSLFQKLILYWHHPKLIGNWISDHVANFNHRQKNHAVSESKSAGFAGSMLRDEERSYHPDEEETTNASLESTTITLCVITTVLSTLYHKHARVRLQAVELLSQWGDTETILFCLPPIMIRLQEETNGVVAIRLLQDVILCGGLVAHRETCTVTFAAVMRIIRNVDARTGGAMYLTGLVGIAKAAKFAPGVSTAVLQTEMEKLRSRFASSQPWERVASAAAIMTLVRARPARGTKFIPLVSLCIAPESMKVAPDAAALCFDAMYLMVCDEVLDPIKAVKVVLKKTKGVFDVAVSARCSFLRLIGSTSAGSSSKKGIVVAEKVIAILHKCVIEGTPQSTKDGQDSECLLWDEVEQAANALCAFSVDEILRIGHCHEDPLINLEAERERLEQIQQECGAFVHKLLSTMRACDSEKTRGSLQAILDKVAKHEWEERPRGAFDPERIAKLTATSEALRRARKAQTGDREADESMRMQFRRAVDKMPCGVVKALCNACGDGDAFAMHAVATAGAVTAALPWCRLADDGLTNGDGDSESGGGCLRVLRCAQGVDFEGAKLRARWLTPGSRNMGNATEGVQVFLGCVAHFEDRVSLVLDHVLRFDVAIAIVRALRFVADRAVRHSAARMVLDMMEQTAIGWSEGEVKALEDALFEECIQDGGEDSIQLLGQARTSGMQMRLVCRFGNATLVRRAVDELVGGCELGADEGMVAVVGRSVGLLSAGGRRSVIYGLAEECCDVGRAVACYAVGAGMLLPDVRRALMGALCLCDVGERVAFRKLAGADDRDRNGDDDLEQPM